ncbi:hypothetical protein CFP56_038594, partial [Quercus suber]
EHTFLLFFFFLSLILSHQKTTFFFPRLPHQRTSTTEQIPFFFLIFLHFLIQFLTHNTHLTHLFLNQVIGPYRNSISQLVIGPHKVFS